MYRDMHSNIPKNLLQIIYKKKEQRKYLLDAVPLAAVRLLLAAVRLLLAAGGRRHCRTRGRWHRRTAREAAGCVPQLGAGVVPSAS